MNNGEWSDSYEDGTFGDVEVVGDALTVRHAGERTHGKLGVQQTQFRFAVISTTTIRSTYTT